MAINGTENRLVYDIFIFFNIKVPDLFVVSVMTFVKIYPD